MSQSPLDNAGNFYRYTTTVAFAAMLKQASSWGWCFRVSFSAFTLLDRVKKRAPSLQKTKVSLEQVEKNNWRNWLTQVYL